MGVILYTIFTRLYFSAISFSAFFSPKARLFKSGRKNIFTRLRKDLLEKPGDYIWFHCASLGEFEQGRPVIEAFKKNFPHYKILLTFFSPSGFEVRKNYPDADLVYYLPEDTESNARQFMDISQPKLVVFIKYEFWHFFIKEIKKRNIPIISVSSIFRKQQLFFRPYGHFYRNILRNFTCFFVQDAKSMELLQNIGITEVIVAGDTRFDRVQEIADLKKDLPEIKAFIQGKRVLVAGSIWKEDLAVLAPLIRDFPDITLIIAPHELQESFINEIGRIFKNSTRYSKNTNIKKQVLIIDNIGLLASLYQFADYAFIGGAYGKGLHNILEASTFGMPIFFGDKSYHKFGEAVNLIKQGGTFPVANYVELKQHISLFEKQPDKRKTVGRICKTFVAENVGATSKIVEYSKMLLKL